MLQFFTRWTGSLAECFKDEIARSISNTTQRDRLNCVSFARQGRSRRRSALGSRNVGTEENPGTEK